MPDVSPFPQGTPCWVDLITDDHAAMLDFYRPLLGWSGEPDPEFGGYAVLGPEGRPVAAIGPPVPGQPSASAAWTVYFAVDDVEAATARVIENDGTPLYGPGEVKGTGRLTVAQDPGGARFGLWQADPFPGIQAGRRLGAPVWFELETFYGPRSARFYAAVLGIEVPPMEQMPDSYWLLTVNGEQVAGIWQDSGEEKAARTPQWFVYFQVADADVTVREAVAAGGRAERAPKDSPYGRFAVLSDPQNAKFSVVSGTSA